MKRQSYKYIFLFNVVFVLSVVIAVFVMQSRNGDEGNIRASITSPLVFSDALNVSFCKNAKAAVLIDAKSGAVLYEKNADTRLPMASTTKIMTALCVIEKAKPEDVVTVSRNAANTEGSSIYLAEGEQITVKDLLYGLMLESGNDAATALAEGVFGSVEECCRYMNKRAHEMGLVNTSFSNPHGLDDENHYTTAYELALVAKIAMNNEVFREIVMTKSYVASGKNDRYFSNHNRLLRSYPKAVGVKTGYTSKSGRCLVSAASDANEEYIAVTLNDSLDWNDHKEMHTFAFDNFDGYEIADGESFCIYSGFSKYKSPENIYITTSGDSAFTLNYKVTADKNTAVVEYSSDSVTLGRFFIEKE